MLCTFSYCETSSDYSHIYVSASESFLYALITKKKMKKKKEERSFLCVFVCNCVCECAPVSHVYSKKKFNYEIQAFSLDFNLRSHMKTHSQENYHICPYTDCGKRYAHEYKLKNHIASHHEKVGSTSSLLLFLK